MWTLLQYDILFEPRLATLRGLMLAKKKPLKTVNLTDIGVELGMIGKAGRQTVVNRSIQPEVRKTGRLFEGQEEETAKQVLEFLTNEDIGQEKLFA